MNEPSVALERAFAHLRRLTREVADLQAVDAENAEARFNAVRDQLVMAALYEIPEVLDALVAARGN